MFVQSKGSLHAVFQRAVERGNLLSAETAARQLGRLALADALKLTLLIGEEEPERFPQVAARWHARFVLESRVHLIDSQIALAAVAALPDARAASVLADLAARYRALDVEASLRGLRQRGA